MPPNDMNADIQATSQARALPAATPDRKSPERRGRDRYPFWTTQRIAAKAGIGVPEDSEFFEVRCFDLSRSGFSFFLSNPPQFDAVVVALDASRQVTYVTGEIVRYQNVRVYPSGKISPIPDREPPEVSRNAMGNPMVLVGVRFVERLQASPGVHEV